MCVYVCVCEEFVCYIFAIYPIYILNWLCRQQQQQQQQQHQHKHHTLMSFTYTETCTHTHTNKTYTQTHTSKHTYNQNIHSNTHTHTRTHTHILDGVYDVHLVLVRQHHQLHGLFDVLLGAWRRRGALTIQFFGLCIKQPDCSISEIN